MVFDGVCVMQCGGVLRAAEKCDRLNDVQYDRDIL